jgi:vitamin B12 transporter
MSLTGEWQAELSHWLVTDLALRHDSFNRFRDATTARASVLAHVGSGVSLAASWGEGIAQPTFTDLYGFFPNGYVGNPDVKPERSTGYEFSARYERGPVGVSLTYFHQRLKDEIVNNATFTSVINADGTSKRQGIEGELHWSPAAWLNLSAGYAWLDATQQTAAGQPEERELRRPKHSGYVAADGQRGRLTYGASLAYTGKHLDQHDSFPFELVDLDSYWLATARIGWRLNDRFEIFGRIHNAFDADYQDAVGYETEGRSVFGGLRIAFGR